MFTPRKTRQASLLAAGTLLTAFALAGCSNNQPETPPTVVNNTAPPAAITTTTTPGATTVTTNPPGPDTKINVNAGPGTSQGTDEATGEAVNKAIVTNKEMTGARVEAVVSAGVATLTGLVQNQQQKALAAKAASDTPGVTSVKNKLQINPTGGAKSASVPKPPVTKIIVVHDKAPAPPAPPIAPSTTGAPASSAGATTGDSSGNTPSDSSSPPSTPAPPAAGSGQ